MKIGRRVIKIIVGFQALFLISYANAGTIIDPDIIVNLQLETLSADVNNNRYMFILRESSSVKKLASKRMEII